jgi:protoheme IX farnesyltransferase
MLRNINNVFKLRIGFAIMLCALAGQAVTAGGALSAWQMTVLALAVFVSSASAGAFNQYIERDLDARMNRTKGRPFVTGEFQAGWHWLAIMGGLLVVAVGMAAFVLNAVSALYVFLGAFVYGIVYTVWLKQRSAWNIVIGGLAGSFAVLAGAAAVDPSFQIVPALLAVVLFLWTPPHFWSLAMALHKDYAQARVPMLPVVIGDDAAARVILAHTICLVAVSLTPVLFGLGPIYLVAALTGGMIFIQKSVALMQDANPKSAMVNFKASLIQLSLILMGAMVDGAVSL